MATAQLGEDQNVAINDDSADIVPLNTIIPLDGLSVDDQCFYQALNIDISTSPPQMGQPSSSQINQPVSPPEISSDGDVDVEMEFNMIQVKAHNIIELIKKMLANNTLYRRDSLKLLRLVNEHIVSTEVPVNVVQDLFKVALVQIVERIKLDEKDVQVCFATCFDQNILKDLRSKEGKAISLRPSSTSLAYSHITGSDITLGPFTSTSTQGITLKKKNFSGKYAISLEEFTSTTVGAKSLNIQYLKGKVPSWIKLPTSVALPFGVFEMVLSADVNKDVANKVSSFSRLVAGGEISKLQDIQENTLRMRAPSLLISELKSKMKNSKIPWPGDEGEEQWNQAWLAIKKVWASKWNERAYISCRKAKLNHNDLCMSVLVQEVISADYAFVIHTRNPLSGDPSEIYTEIVKGLGETLVGAYPGRAMSFVTKKSDLKSPKVLGYPSKQMGLYIKRSIIFRSDSNGEDLAGYAGAGLYDSVVMDKEERVVLDYSSDKLIVDKSFQRSVFSKIAEAGKIIEGLYGSAQDIEGVVKDGEIYVVQTRPQM